MSQHHTTDEIFATTELPASKEPSICFVDVHIYDYVPEEEVPDIESTLEDVLSHEKTERNQPQSHEYSHFPPALQRRRVYPFLIACGVLGMCVVIGGCLVFLLPLFTSSATVTVVPVSTLITSTDAIAVVPGMTQSDTHQIGGRLLSSIMMAQAQDTPTTGSTHQEAHAANGWMTFYNSQPTIQAISAGTLITGEDGVSVVTDQDAIIPAVSYPTLGQVSVPAHATILGPGGNIGARDIYGPCCRLNVSAVNSVFSGGQNARTYPTVTAQDITSVASRLKTSLEQSIQAALQTQVHPDETLITPLPCTYQVQPDHQPGAEATQVHITLNETCTGEVYRSSVLHTIALQILAQKAGAQLGEGYQLTGEVQTSILQTISKGHNQVLVSVKSVGTWVYQFTPDQLHQLKAIIAGKKKMQAMNALLHVPGVHTVSITIKNGDTLPTDSNHIQLLVFSYAL